MAKYFGVAPWDLAAQDEAWLYAGLIASGVENQMREWEQAKQKRRSGK